MKKLFVLAILALTITAMADTKTITGVLTDDMCTKKHMIAGKSDADCVRECIKHGSKYAVAAGGKSYILKGDQKQFDALAGQIVSVTGDMNGNTLVVKKITSAQ